MKNIEKEKLATPATNGWFNSGAKHISRKTLIEKV